jgi:hypothetical protein
MWKQMSEWVSEWMGGLPIDTHRIKTNEWKDGWDPIPSKWKENERVIYIEATNERPTQTHLHKMYKGWTENPHTVQ